MMTLSKNILFAAISGVIVALVYFKFSEPDSQNSSSSKSSSAEITPSKQPKTTRRTHENWEDLTAKSLRQGSGRNFAQQIQKIDLVSV